ncbi:MAG: ANTAR domain-containing protein [Lachnospiraceae bacterium]|nr:ANTAR domain-containing protein [Lachnospiraceae bacterium]
MNIVVAFPKIENAKNIKRILVKSGYQVNAVCTTGSQVLQQVNSLGGGILICGYRFVDMSYMEIKEYLPDDFEMLLLGAQANIINREGSDVICLSTPFKVHELVHTLEMMAYTYEEKCRKRRKVSKERTSEEEKILREAKNLLMERNEMTEEEAHRYIQKSSMDSGTGMIETAEMILSLMRW